MSLLPYLYQTGRLTRMMKRGVKDLSVIAILLIISQVFGGVVSAVDGV